MISVHFLYACALYDCDISNRWINNTEKKLKMMRSKKKRERPICDYWLHCEFFAALLLLCCVWVFFFSLISSRFLLCRASWSISRQKVHNFFSDNFPGQKRSFFPHSLFSTSSCVSVLIFFSYIQLLLLLLMRLWKDHFFTLCSVSSFVKFLCVQNTQSQRIVLVYDDLLWMNVWSWIVCSCVFFYLLNFCFLLHFFFIFFSFAFTMSMPSLH